MSNSRQRLKVFSHLSIIRCEDRGSHYYLETSLKHLLVGEEGHSGFVKESTRQNRLQRKEQSRAEQRGTG